MYKVIPVYLDGENDLPEHYEIYKNGNLVATCNNGEIKETIEDLINM